MSYSHAFALPQYQDAKTKAKGKRALPKKKVRTKTKKNRRPTQGNYNEFY